MRPSGNFICTKKNPNFDDFEGLNVTQGTVPRNPSTTKNFIRITQWIARPAGIHHHHHHHHHSTSMAPSTK